MWVLCCLCCVEAGGSAKLIIIHYYRSGEGQIEPITAEAGQAQTHGGSIQWRRAHLCVGVVLFVLCRGRREC